MNEDLAANRRRGTGRRIAAAEEGRRRIAREVHDDFSQRLAALALELKATRKKLPDGDPRRCELDATSTSMEELGEDLRRLSHDLHPAALERHGLTAALRDHCHEIERRHGPRVELGLSGAEDSFPSDIALGLYRIVQEALANTVRHSAAGTARVTLSVTAGMAHLTVADDGGGFDPGEAEHAGGLGLASIAERAQWLGGRCRVASALGEGTALEVTVPLPAPDGTFSHLGELVRRHRGLVASTLLVILALAAGLAATALQARRARQEAKRADAAARFLEDLFQASDPRLARGRVPDTREILQRGTRRLGKELRGQPLLRAQLLDTLGGIHTALGLFDEARPLLQEALTLRERLRGSEDLEVAATLVRLGSLAHLSGKGDAVALFERALAIREARLGDQHPDVADALNKLGIALVARGRFDEAEATLRRSFALQERLWGEHDLRVAKVMHNLGGIAYDRGRVDDAAHLIERSLAVREASLAPDDPDLAVSLEALALLRQKQGRLAEAAQLLERRAPIAEQVYGPAHPELARILFNLGLVRKDLGEDSAARQLLERALRIDEKALAPDHRQLVRALANLADLHFEHGRYAEAEPLFRRLLKLREGGATYDHWDLSLVNWARLLRATGRDAEAARVEARTAPPS